MEDKSKSKLIRAAGVFLATGFVVIEILGNRLNSNQLLGCLVVGAFMFGISLVAFLFGALPFRTVGASDKTIRRAFIFACFSLAYSILQIPLWSCMTHQFPPGTMGDTQAGFVTFGVIISLFGPAAPLIVRFARFIRERDKEQALRRKKAERDEP
jgi:Na+/melibiose symporter-like transporter